MHRKNEAEPLSEEELKQLIEKKRKAISALTDMKTEMEAEAQGNLKIADLLSNNPQADLENKHDEWVKDSKINYINKTIAQLTQSKKTLDLLLEAKQNEAKTVHTLSVITSTPKTTYSISNLGIFRFFSNLFSMMPSPRIWRKNTDKNSASAPSDKK